MNHHQIRATYASRMQRVIITLMQDSVTRILNQAPRKTLPGGCKCPVGARLVCDLLYETRVSLMIHAKHIQHFHNMYPVVVVGSIISWNCCDVNNGL